MPSRPALRLTGLRAFMASRQSRSLLRRQRSSCDLCSQTRLRSSQVRRYRSVCLSSVSLLMRRRLTFPHRWPLVPARDHLPPHPQPGVRTRWMGPGSSRRHDRREPRRLPRMGPRRWREVSLTRRVCALSAAHIYSHRLVSIARGEQAYFDQSGLATATEGCKSNALMRCCKDLGVASELW